MPKTAEKKKKNFKIFSPVRPNIDTKDVSNKSRNNSMRKRNNVSPNRKQREKTQIEENEVNNQNAKKRPTKKFNQKEFEKRLEKFNAWEQKKKEKIEKLQKEKKQKEMEKYNKNNIHNKKRISCQKIPSIIDRLYSKDIHKRKQKKIILTQIYTPTFTPFLYTKKENIRKSQKKIERNDYHKTQSQRNIKVNARKDNFDNNNFSTVYNKKKSEKLLGDDIDRDEFDDEEVKKHNKYRKVYSKKNLNNLTINIDKNIPTINDSIYRNERFSDNEDEETERIFIENAYRNRLFKHKK